MGLRGLCNGLERCASGTQHQTMGAAPRSEGGILLHRFFSERPVLVGQRLHLSHDHHLIRSWGIRHEKRFDVDEVLYQDYVKKLLVWYLFGPHLPVTRLRRITASYPHAAPATPLPPLR